MDCSNCDQLYSGNCNCSDHVAAVTEWKRDHVRELADEIFS